MHFKDQVKAAIGSTSIAIALVLGTPIFSPPASARPTLDVTGGTTQLTLTPTVAGVLAQQGIQITPLIGSTLVGRVSTFPVTGGGVDRGIGIGGPELDLFHGGGLRFRRAATTVVLSDFLVTTVSVAPNGDQLRPSLVGLVTVNNNLVARGPLFDLIFPTITPPLPVINNRAVIRSVGVLLSEGGAAALNRAFNVTLFTPGLRIGTATVTVNLRSQ